MISNIVDKYHFLADDVLIIATCIENNISILTSFDSDFLTADEFNLLFFESNLTKY